MVRNLSVLSDSPLPTERARVPQSVGENRFGNWLANARDWNISRNRYWGTPLPLWASDDFEEVRSTVRFIVGQVRIRTILFRSSSSVPLRNWSG